MFLPIPINSIQWLGWNGGYHSEESGLPSSIKLFKESECEADGIQLMPENRVNLAGMKELMTHLQQSNKSSILAVSFISSHSLTKDRINMAEEYILGTSQISLKRTRFWKKFGKSLN